jgi:peptidoglycan-associated lipoprotein
MNSQGLRIVAIATLVASPIVAGCAAQQAWTPALAGSAPARSSALADADVPPTTQAPVAPPRMALAPAPPAPGSAASTPAVPIAPAPAPEAPIGLPRVKDYEAIPELRDIYFDSGKAAIRLSDRRILDANAAWLRANPSQLLLIEGHSDARGLSRDKNEFNMVLGEERARAAMNYLVAHGVQPSRITILSYGEERPTCAESSERCWSLNRRSRFLVKPR